MPGMPPEGANDLASYVEDLFAWMRDEVGIDLTEMLSGDDWMLVIKLHAMIESALNIALVLELGEPRLETVIGKLDTSDGSRGKVAFAKTLGLLEKSSIDYLQALSGLRNFCIHNIRNFKFDLRRYLETHEKANELRVALKKGVHCMAFQKNVMEAFNELVISNPRLALFLGSFGIMMQLHLHDEKCRRRDVEAQLCQRKAARLDEIEPEQSTSKE